MNLPDVSGLIDVYLLPGQGRAPGSITAFLHVLRFKSDLGETAEDPQPTDMALKLDGYNAQNRVFPSDDFRVSPPFPSSRTFTNFDLTFADQNPGGSVQGVTVENNNGNQVPATTSPSQEVFLNEFQVTVMRGRTTAVQFFFNDSMMVDNGGFFSLDRTAFIDQNRNPEINKIRGFFSDYLQFDISNVANRPSMPSPLQFPPQESHANMVFFSGDSYAIGDKDARGVNGSNGLFVYLTPSSFFEGFYRPQDPTTLVKSYELKQADPTDINLNPRLITALKGTYHNYTEYLSNLHPVEFILMPKSGDGSKQDIVIIKRTGDNITDMWFGTANYAVSGGATFKVYPIKNLYPASTAGEITGTLPSSDMIDASGSGIATTGANWWQNVRGGTYKFNTVPSGLTKTGDFLVFRK